MERVEPERLKKILEKFRGLSPKEILEKWKTLPEEEKEALIIAGIPIATAVATASPAVALLSPLYLGLYEFVKATLKGWERLGETKKRKLKEAIS